MKRFKNIYEKYNNWLILLCLAICFFIVTASYNYTIQKDDFVKWSSPDATANYIFTKLYAQTGELKIFEKYNLIAEEIIHPRSIRSDWGELKPVSFLGIILIYGKVASVLGYKVIPYLTPFFASLGLIFFYLLIKEIFGKNNALLSVFILAFFPPFIYYTARSMFHNVLFISLLLIGFYFAVIMAKKRKQHWQYFNLFFSALAGVFIGLAIITRTSELLWLGPVLLLSWIFNIKKIGITKLIIFLSFLSLAVLPMVYWNQILYSSPTSGGYPEMNQALTNLSQASVDLLKITGTGQIEKAKNILETIRDNIFHFGFNAKQSMKMFYYYFFDMFTALFALAGFGFLLFLENIYKWKKKHLVYILCFFVWSVVLIFYYGSWEFHDNPDPNSFTIGNSYTRYWLPIYLGAIPFASYFIIKFSLALFPKKRKGKDEKEVGDNIFYHLGKSKFLNKKYFGLPRRRLSINAFRVLVIVMMCFFSTSFVLYGSEEGLVYSALKQKATRAEWKEIMDLTPTNAVIITQYHDKLFFPERKVINGLFNDKHMNKIYARLSEKMPVYYYNFTFPEKDSVYLNDNKLKSVGLQIEKVKQINQNFSLYKLDKASNSSKK